MILQYRQIAYYRDLQGRYYRAALGFPDEIVPDGVDVSSDEDCSFYGDLRVDESSVLWDILEGDERVLDLKRKIREASHERVPKIQPLYRKLP